MNELTHKLCNTCKQEKSKYQFSKLKTKKAGKIYIYYRNDCNECRKKKQIQYQKDNRDFINSGQRNYAAKVKLEVFTYYSKGKLCCNCCGEDNYIFLTLEHSLDNGNNERQSIGNSDRIYAYLRRNNFPEGYEILCYNCNMGKYQNNGICPHKIILYNVLGI